MAVLVQKIGIIRGLQFPNFWNKNSNTPPQTEDVECTPIGIALFVGFGVSSYIPSICVNSVMHFSFSLPE